NPILYKPILKTEEGYVILSPASLCLALTDFIWSMAAEHGCMPQVNDAYHDAVWNNVQLQLQHLRFKSINIDGLDSIGGTRDGLYKFDDDKIAYIYYFSDDGQNYNANGSSFSGDLSSIKKERLVAAIASLKANPIYKDF